MGWKIPKELMKLITDSILKETDRMEFIYKMVLSLELQELKAKN